MRKINSWDWLSQRPTIIDKGSKILQNIVTISGESINLPFSGIYASEIFIQPFGDIYVGNEFTQLLTVPSGATLILDFNFPENIYMKSKNGDSVNVVVAITTWEGQ